MEKAGASPPGCLVGSLRPGPPRQVPHNLLDRSVNRLQPGQEPTALRLWQPTQLVPRRQLGLAANDGQMRLDDVLEGRR
jgi:hypothetical protein